MLKWPGFYCGRVYRAWDVTGCEHLCKALRAPPGRARANLSWCLQRTLGQPTQPLRVVPALSVDWSVGKAHEDALEEGVMAEASNPLASALTRDVQVTLQPAQERFLSA